MSNPTIRIKPELGYIALKTIKWLYLSVALFVIGIIVGHYENLFAYAAGLVLFVGIYKFLQFRSIKYTINNKQLSVERGLFAKQITYLELFRVEDFEVRQSLVGRIFGFGDLILISREITNRKQTLEGIAQAPQTAEILREATLVARRENKIIGIG